MPDCLAQAGPHSGRYGPLSGPIMCVWMAVVRRLVWPIQRPPRSSGTPLWIAPNRKAMPQPFEHGAGAIDETTAFT